MFGKINIAAITIIALLLCGCMDQDPFGLSMKSVAGPYKMELFESGAYYMHGPNPDINGGGILEGTVKEIGWTADYIFARRYANFRGDPDGWMIIDVKQKRISGPVDEQTFHEQFPNVKTMSPDEAWKKL